MLAQFTLLLTCQLIGELSVRLADLPVPGPVLGMLLLFGLLCWRGDVPAPLQATGGGLLDHLSLLFVPAGVGIISHLPLLMAEWPAIATALIASTLLTIVVTAWTMAWLSRRIAASDSEANNGGRQ